MVKRAFIGAAALIVIGVLGYLIWLNPGAVDFQPFAEQTLRVPLGWLLVFAFAAGAGVAGAAVLAQQVIARLRTWRQRRRDRMAGRVAGWEQAGLALVWDGEIDRARALLLKAWRRAPENHGAALALASSYMDTGEIERARQVLEEAVTHDASDADVRFALSEALRRTGRLGEAIRMLETVRVQYPRAPRALLGLREMYREARRWNEAAQLQEAYLAALPLEQRSGSERQRLLDLRYQALMSGDSGPARIDALRAVVDADRNYVPAIAALAEALAEAEEEQEATRLLDRAVRHAPCLLLIERLLALHKLPRERQRFLSWLRRHPEIGDDVVHFLSARAALDEGNVDEAAAELEKISDLAQPAVHRLWAEVHRQRGAVRDAFRALNQFVEADPARREGVVCALCRRVPEERGSAVPRCQYWDGIRALGAD
jgi:tetratricopeptide (TPR) repeat protein